MLVHLVEVLLLATNTLTGLTSGATGTIAASGVSSAYDWYTAPANVKF